MATIHDLGGNEFRQFSGEAILELDKAVSDIIAKHHPTQMENGRLHVDYRALALMLAMDNVTRDQSRVQKEIFFNGVMGNMKKMAKVLLEKGIAGLMMGR